MPTHAEHARTKCSAEGNVGVLLPPACQRRARAARGEQSTAAMLARCAVRVRNRRSGVATVATSCVVTHAAAARQRACIKTPGGRPHAPPAPSGARRAAACAEQATALRRSAQPPRAQRGHGRPRARVLFFSFQASAALCAVQRALFVPRAVCSAAQAPSLSFSIPKNTEPHQYARQRHVRAQPLAHAARPQRARASAQRRARGKTQRVNASALAAAPHRAAFHSRPRKPVRYGSISCGCGRGARLSARARRNELKPLSMSCAVQPARHPPRHHRAAVAVERSRRAPAARAS